jgi:hypothetical protein
MVREFLYGGGRYRATVHGKPGKEEIFIVQMLEDDDEGPEISLDRFESPDNDPAASLETVLAAMVDTLLQEQGLAQATPDQVFAWVEAQTAVKVHSGVQH